MAKCTLCGGNIITNHGNISSSGQHIQNIYFAFIYLFFCLFIYSIIYLLVFFVFVFLKTTFHSNIKKQKTN